MLGWFSSAVTKMLLIQFLVSISVHVLSVFVPYLSPVGVVTDALYLSGNKHRSEFKFLVDQVNKRWKKIGERKAESARNKEEVAVKELPAAIGQSHFLLSSLGPH